MMEGEPGIGPASPSGDDGSEGQVAMTDSQEWLLLSETRESGESTPENWQTSYARYLQDSPISMGTPRREPGKQTPSSSPKKTDKVDQGLQKQATAQYEAVQRRAERFFTENAPSYEDNKPRPEGIIQWMRVQIFEEVLLAADYLFHVLGSTTPSLDAPTMEELVLGQYQLARDRGLEEWVRSARQWATTFFPLNWIDSHLLSTIPGKRLRLKPREQNVDDSPRPTMVQDRRVTVEGQNLPCVRSNLAEEATVSQGAVGVASPGLVSSPARSQTNEGRSTLPLTGMSENVEGSRSEPAGTTKTKDRSSRDKKRDHEPRSHRGNRSPGRPRHHNEPTRTDRHAGEKRRHAPEASQSEIAPKRPASGAYQICPAEGCDHRSKFLKEHVYKAHIPSLFHQLTLATVKSRNIHRQRLHGLDQLAISLVGVSAMPEDLVTAVNQDILRIIAGPTNIWGQLQGDMEALCRYAGWEIPERFEVYPRLNSPASLLYWRVMVSLLDRLSSEDRREFLLSYNSTGRGKAHESSETRTRHRDRQSSQGIARVEQSDVEEGPQSVRVICSGDSERMIRLAAPADVDFHQALLFSNQIPARLQAFDSHFHLDRTAKKLWEGRRDPSKVQVEDILNYPLKHSPRNVVELVGGVMIFCDPEDLVSIPLTDGKWKIAVGVHPRKAVGCPEHYLTRIKALLDTNPLVKALGEIGLDRTEPEYTWSDQDGLLKKMLALSRPDKVIVLHLRGSSDKNSSDVLLAGLHYVRKACPPSQRIHLHCFTGNQATVEYWLEEFPNTFFGFTARVTSFNLEQQEGLRAVPFDRLLLETDSPYMPVEAENRVNTPAYLGDVAECVSRIRRMNVRELLAVTTSNGQQLYQ